MDTRLRSEQLELAVLAVLWKTRPAAFHDVRVRAAPNGSVWLRGSVSTQAESVVVQQIVRDVPGVKQVFCHFAPRAPREVCHA